MADLKDAIRMKRESIERPFKISGRIIDENGSPVSRAYALANISEEIVKFPKFLSAWVDEGGSYTMYVPRGKYYIGGASEFPPGQDYIMKSEMSIDSDLSELDIIMKTGDTK